MIRKKWLPAFRKDHAPPEIESATSIRLKAIALQPQLNIIVMHLMM